MAFQSASNLFLFVRSFVFRLLWLQTFIGIAPYSLFACLFIKKKYVFFGLSLCNFHCFFLFLNTCFFHITIHFFNKFLFQLSFGPHSILFFLLLLVSFFIIFLCSPIEMNLQIRLSAAYHAHSHTHLHLHSQQQQEAAGFQLPREFVFSMFVCIVCVCACYLTIWRFFASCHLPKVFMMI